MSPETGGDNTGIRVIDILLVDDNPADVRMAQEFLKDHRILNSMNIVEDGEEALAFLRRRGQYASVRRPDLVLLDLNLPKMDGIEVLEEIYADPELADTSVVILAASPHQNDIAKRFNLPTECYLKKPLTLDSFLQAVRCFPHLHVSIVAVARA